MTFKEEMKERTEVIEKLLVKYCRKQKVTRARSWRRWSTV